MATITLNDAAPKNTPIHFTFGGVDFDLGSDGASFDTTDPAVISDAGRHEWLTVTLPEVDRNPAPADYDPNDPHDNPAADHLGSQATPEVKQAALENEAAIFHEAYPDTPLPSYDIAPADPEPAVVTVTATPIVAPQAPATSDSSDSTDTPKNGTKENKS